MSEYETLRRAAALMRELAEAATGSPWGCGAYGGEAAVLAQGDIWVARCGDHDIAAVRGDARHIASWHPAAALAVADWLESTAHDVEHVHSPVYNLTSTTVARALTVARAYLGEPA